MLCSLLPRSCGISRAVEAMETSAGFRILRRGKKGVSLTREGEALLPPEHPMANEKSVPAEIFEREPYIEIHTGQETDNSHCFESRGISPNIKFSTPDSFVAWRMVKAGLGVTLVNRVISEELGAGVACVPLRPPEKVEICAILPERELISPAAESFAAYAANYIEELKKL